MREPIVRYQQRRWVQRVAQKQFSVADVPPVPFKMHGSSEPVTPTDVILSKASGYVDVLINQRWPWYFLFNNASRIAAHIYWFSQTSDSIRRIIVDISDGDLPVTATYKWATTSSLHTVLPDAFFFRDHGYRKTDRFAADQAPDWDDRRDDIVWRGGPNGTGMFSLDPTTVNNPGVIQRLRMAQKCRDLDVDFRFIYDPNQPFCDVLKDAGLIGNYVMPHDWGGMKYAIDIDGFSNAWDNFMQRLKLGCCVLKVDSQLGFYQWYYHHLVPWEHFVPVRADLTDLAEKIDWVRTHQSKAKAIAAHGQAFAKAMTFETETVFAADAITQREQGS